MRTALAGIVLAALPLHGVNAQQPKAAPATNAFAVQVSLSPSAARRLAALKETVTVSISYYGAATPAREGDANFDGDIELGDDTLTLPATGGTATITGAKLRSARLSWIVGRAVQVRTAIVSSRRVSRDNLLNCTPYLNGPLSQLRGKTHQVTCRLIGEPIR